MSFHYSPKIVTDGLVFYVDAANPKSYISGNTTCNDLISNVTGTLENGVGFSIENNGGWLFDGFNGYMTFGDLTYINPELNSFTCNFFFKIDPNTLNTNAILTKGSSSSNLIGWAIYYSDINGVLEIRCNGDNTTTQRAGQHIPINENQIYMASLVINRTDNTIKGYLNGSNVSWVNGTYNQAFTGNSISGFGSITSTDDFFVGKRSNLGTPLPMFGNIYLVSCYNSALSQTEITQNYNALKSRFQS
jgi:hypothetical protein